MRVVIMGVTGCGKSSVGARLAASLGWPFADADDFHPEANVASMAAGIPLTDADRWPWLDAVGEWMAEHPDGVVACSALKRVYRDRLRDAAGSIVVIHLAGKQSVITERVVRRSEAEGHFAGADLVASQYATLQPLGFDEVGATIDVSHGSLDHIVDEALDVVALQED